MRRISLVYVGLGFALAGCQADAETSTDSGAAYSEQALECTDDAEACAAECAEAAGIDTGLLEACAVELEACVEANPLDAACLEIAEKCLNVDIAASVEGLTDCLTTCEADFGDCLPDPPADTPDTPVPDELVACAEATADCLVGCAGDVLECELPVVECGAVGLEVLFACIDTAGGDPEAVTACVEEVLADVCLRSPLISPRAPDASRRARRGPARRPA